MDLVWYPWEPGQPGRGKRRRSFQEQTNKLSRLFLKTVAAVVPVNGSPWMRGDARRVFESTGFKRPCSRMDGKWPRLLSRMFFCMFVFFVVVGFFFS